MTNEQYEEWFRNLSTEDKLKELELEDTPLNRGWVECPDFEAQAEYVENIPNGGRNFNRTEIKFQTENKI